MWGEKFFFANPNLHQGVIYGNELLDLIVVVYDQLSIGINKTQRKWFSVFLYGENHLHTISLSTYYVFTGLCLLQKLNYTLFSITRNSVLANACNM